MRGVRSGWLIVVVLAVRRVRARILLVTAAMLVVPFCRALVFRVQTTVPSMVVLFSRLVIFLLFLVFLVLLCGECAERIVPGKSFGRLWLIEYALTLCTWSVTNPN